MVRTVGLALFLDSTFCERSDSLEDFLDQINDLCQRAGVQFALGDGNIQAILFGLRKRKAPREFLIWMNESIQDAVKMNEDYLTFLLSKILSHDDHPSTEKITEIFKDFTIQESVFYPEVLKDLVHRTDRENDLSLRTPAYSILDLEWSRYSDLTKKILNEKIDLWNLGTLAAELNTNFGNRYSAFHNPFLYHLSESYHGTPLDQLTVGSIFRLQHLIGEALALDFSATDDDSYYSDFLNAEDSTLRSILTARYHVGYGIEYEPTSRYPNRMEGLPRLTEEILAREHSNTFSQEKMDALAQIILADLVENLSLTQAKREQLLPFTEVLDRTRFRNSFQAIYLREGLSANPAQLLETRERTIESGYFGVFNAVRWAETRLAGLEPSESDPEMGFFAWTVYSAALKYFEHLEKGFRGSFVLHPGYHLEPMRGRILALEDQLSSDDLAEGLKALRDRQQGDSEEMNQLLVLGANLGINFLDQSFDPSIGHDQEKQLLRTRQAARFHQFLTEVSRDHDDLDQMYSKQLPNVFFKHQHHRAFSNTRNEETTNAWSETYRSLAFRSLLSTGSEENVLESSRIIEHVLQLFDDPRLFHRADLRSFFRWNFGTQYLQLSPQERYILRSKIEFRLADTPKSRVFREALLAEAVSRLPLRLLDSESIAWINRWFDPSGDGRRVFWNYERWSLNTNNQFQAGETLILRTVQLAEDLGRSREPTSPRIPELLVNLDLLGMAVRSHEEDGTPLFEMKADLSSFALVERESFTRGLQRAVLFRLLNAQGGHGYWKESFDLASGDLKVDGKLREYADWSLSETGRIANEGLSKDSFETNEAESYTGGFTVDQTSGHSRRLKEEIRRDPRLKYEPYYKNHQKAVTRTLLKLSPQEFLEELRVIQAERSESTPLLILQESIELELRFQESLMTFRSGLDYVLESLEIEEEEVPAAILLQEN